MDVAPSEIHASHQENEHVIVKPPKKFFFNEGAS